MPRISLVDREFGDLKVIGYNEEYSKARKRKCWDCKCKLCGSVKPIQERLLMAGKTDCGCQSNKRKSDSQFNKNIGRRMEHAESLIGQKTELGSEILRIVSKPERNKDVIFELRCGKCGELYTASGYNLNRNTNKLCPKCSVGLGGKPKRDYTGLDISSLKVIRSLGGDNWECEKNGYTTIKTSNQLRKKEYDEKKKLENQNKQIQIPFVFVNKEDYKNAEFISQRT